MNEMEMKVQEYSDDVRLIEETYEVKVKFVLDQRPGHGQFNVIVEPKHDDVEESDLLLATRLISEATNRLWHDGTGQITRIK